VFIHNTRPGAMKRAGLDAETLRAEHPGLIHASISGYGQTGPYAADPGFDTLFQCISGLCYMQGKDKPEMVRTLIVDKVTSPVVAQAICAALVRRGRTGEGATIEHSMLEGFIWWLWPDGMTNTTFIGEEGVKRAPDLADVDMLSPTDDGYLMAAPHMQHHWEAFCKLVDRPDLLDREGFRTAGERMQNLVEYFAEVRSCFKGKTTAEWCALLREAEIPNAPVLRPEELENHPQVQWSNCIEIVEDERLGRYRSPRAPVRVDGLAAGTVRPPQPPGVDTEAVLRDWGVAR
jgi:crotonobetainyl-CoA:carnitine CoA-transferase CaiB-like acyl-CoA transferase